MERLSQGQIIAAVAAAVLVVAEFLPWFGGGGQNENIWKGATLDEYLLITAIVAALPAVLAMSGAAEEFSFISAATFLLGVVGFILIVLWLTVDFDFPEGVDRKWGAFVALGAVAVVAYGGFRSMQDEVAAEL
jgi:drug/metabolite transporter (DMT)-like permease